MPGFLYTNQTNFRPFSYQEMLAPVLMATQAHQAVEEAYSELDSQANAIGSLANEANDPVTYQRYKAYESALRTQADALAKNGLTPGSRQSLLDLKGRYAKDITPIQNAITRRRELADEQRKALLQNPTLMFERDMNSLSYESSLDRFLENPDYDYGTQYSGALITEQVSKAASNLARELRSAEAGELDEYTKLFLQNYGLSSKEVLDAINDPNNPKSSRALSAIYDSVLQNVPQAIKEKYYNDVRGYATRGFWSAIGQNKATPYEDYGARIRAKYGNQYPDNEIATNTFNLYSSRELDKAEKEYKTNVKKYSQYFEEKDGQWVMNAEGWKAYNAKRYIPGIISPTTGTVITQGQAVDSDFKKFIDGLKGSGATSSESIGNLWGNYVNNSPASQTAKYDAMKATGIMFDVPQTPEYQRSYKTKISRAIDSTEKLTEVDADIKNGRWVDTGNTLSLEDLSSDDYTIVSRAPTDFGTVIYIAKKGEKAKPYLAPTGVHLTAEEGRDQAVMERVEVRRKLLNDNLTPESRRKLENYYYDLTNQIIMFESQLDLTNETKDQQFNPYYIP